MEDCEYCRAKIRELEIRVIGVDGNNGLQGRVTELERVMKEELSSLRDKLDSIAEARNERLRNLELRVYFICGIPSIVAGTVTMLKLFGMIN